MPTITLAVVCAFTATCDIAASPITAHASSIWLHNVDFSLFGFGTTAGGTWTLGKNEVDLGLVPFTAGPISGSYASIGNALFRPSVSSGGSTGAARSQIEVIRPYNPNELTSYVMTAFANASAAVLGPTVEATGRASDPQVVATPGMFGATISLGVGSQVSAEAASQPGEASSSSSTFQLFGPGVTIASMAFSADDTGNFGVSVSFGNDPRLSILDPSTLLPITAADVESRLLNSTLNQPGGLTSTLDLFRYQFDDSSGSPGDLFTSDVTSAAAASSVPEPTTASFIGTALAAALVFVVRRARG